MLRHGLVRRLPIKSLDDLFVCNHGGSSSRHKSALDHLLQRRTAHRRIVDKTLLPVGETVKQKGHVEAMRRCDQALEVVRRYGLGWIVVYVGHVEVADQPDSLLGAR